MQAVHEGIVAGREYEDERIEATLGQIGGRHVTHIADIVDDRFDPLPGHATHAGTLVQHPVHGRKADARCSGDIVNGWPHVSSFEDT